MAKVNNTINKEENIMANNYSKMLRADLIKLVENLQTENNTQQVLIDRLQEKNTAQALRLKEAERHYRSMVKTAKHLRFLYNQVQAKKSYKTNSHMDKLSADTDRHVTESYPEPESKISEEELEDTLNALHDDNYYTPIQPTAEAIDALCLAHATFRYDPEKPFKMPETLSEGAARAATIHLRNNNLGFRNYSQEIYRRMRAMDKELHTIYEESGRRYTKTTFKEAANLVKHDAACTVYTKLCDKYNTTFESNVFMKR